MDPSHPTGSQQVSDDDRNLEQLLKTLESSINCQIDLFKNWEGANPNPNLIVNILKSLAKSPVFKRKRNHVDNNKTATTSHNNSSSSSSSCSGSSSGTIRRPGLKQPVPQPTTSIKSEVQDVIDLDSDSDPSSPVSSVPLIENEIQNEHISHTHVEETAQSEPEQSPLPLPITTKSTTTATQKNVSQVRVEPASTVRNSIIKVDPEQARGNPIASTSVEQERVDTKPGNLTVNRQNIKAEPMETNANTNHNNQDLGFSTPSHEPEQEPQPVPEPETEDEEESVPSSGVNFINSNLHTNQNFIDKALSVVWGGTPVKNKGQNALSPSGAGPSSSKKRSRVPRNKTKNTTSKQPRTSKKSKTKECQLRKIPQLLQLIQDILLSPQYDKQMELLWEEICSLTYECTVEVDLRGAEFLAGNGLTVARSCFDSFPWENELILNIMIALGNLAEVDTFRPKLMTFQTVSMLIVVVGTKNYSFKTNYRAAGVLADLYADGPKAWTIHISRDEVLKDFRNLMTSKWNIKTELISKGFEYKSLKCFIKMLRCNHTPECILYACWTIANLTWAMPEDYAVMLKREETEVWMLLQSLKGSSDKTIAKFVSIAIAETDEFLVSVK